MGGGGWWVGERVMLTAASGSDGGTGVVGGGRGRGRGRCEHWQCDRVLGVHRSDRTKPFVELFALRSEVLRAYFDLNKGQ